MLDPGELAAVAASFGVDDTQVIRDHLISHVLHALEQLAQPVTFFGGTALHRCHFPTAERGGRLSEDIDLYGPARRRTAQVLEDELPRILHREFPGCRWDPRPTQVKAVQSASLVTREGVRLRIQLLPTANHGYAHWPTEVRPVDMRYRDVAPTEMRVPTLAAFAGMKTCAWHDRKAARDLYDLAALARVGALDTSAAALVRQMTGYPVAPHFFDQQPPGDWANQLAHQVRDLPSPASCLAAVRDAYGQVLGWANHGLDEPR
jgi:predicted nucleotidyltransferase component of viral defense system